MQITEIINNYMPWIASVTAILTPIVPMFLLKLHADKKSLNVLNSYKDSLKLDSEQKIKIDFYLEAILKASEKFKKIEAIFGEIENLMEIVNSIYQEVNQAKMVSKIEIEKIEQSVTQVYEMANEVAKLKDSLNIVNQSNIELSDLKTQVERLNNRLGVK